jgi:hypothetical protein
MAIPRLYVEAYGGNGRQILGNLDGQMCWHSSRYKNAEWYRRLSSFPTLNNRVAEYRIVDDVGRVLERVHNKTYRRA